MDNDSQMKLMKDRIIKSYAWQRDVIIPLSNDFGCSCEELEEVFFELFDMTTLEAMHGTFESAGDLCLLQKFHADLRLCWFIQTLEVISPKEGDELKEKLLAEVKKGRPYDEVLNEGQKELFQLLKNLQL